jgi:hypothetical protein
MDDWAEVRRLHRAEGISIKEIARRMGLAAQGVLPCLHLRRRRVIPRRAVDLLIEECVGSFDPRAVLPRLGRSADGG